jgi:hypothetical protein
MAEVEVYEVLRLCSRLSVCGQQGEKNDIHTMCHEAAKVTSHDAVPCRALSLIELVWTLKVSFGCSRSRRDDPSPFRERNAE